MSSARRRITSGDRYIDRPRVSTTMMYPGTASRRSAMAGVRAGIVENGFAARSGSPVSAA
jgi:hypothetical protein